MNGVAEGRKGSAFSLAHDRSERLIRNPSGHKEMLCDDRQAGVHVLSQHLALPNFWLPLRLLQWEIMC